MVYVYVLISEKDNTLYIGLTNDMQRRIREHNLGRNKSTKSKIPYRLLFFEIFNSYLEARKKEKYLKSGIGRESIKQRAGIV